MSDNEKDSFRWHISHAAAFCLLDGPRYQPFENVFREVGAPFTEKRMDMLAEKPATVEFRDPIRKQYPKYTVHEFKGVGDSCNVGDFRQLLGYTINHVCTLLDGGKIQDVDEVLGILTASHHPEQLLSELNVPGTSVHVCYGSGAWRVRCAYATLRGSAKMHDYLAASGRT